MTQRFLTTMTSKGYSEAEAQAQWDQAMTKIDKADPDPIYTTMLEMYPDEATTREEYAIGQVEDAPVKAAGPASISADPLKSDSGGAGMVPASGSAPVPGVVPAVPAVTARSGGTQSSKYTPPSIDNDDLRKQMNDYVTSLLAEKQNRTTHTSIMKVLTKTPDPSSFLAPGGVPKQVTISTAMDKITKFESAGTLEPVKENLEAYQAWKAAAESKTPVEVYYNDDNNRRIVGVIIKTLGEDGQQRDMILSAKDLEAFLLGQVSGIITNGQAYVKLANWKKKTKMENGQPNTSITLTVQWTKKGYFWENNMVDSVSMPMTPAKAAEQGCEIYESKTVKTKASFVVVEQNPNPVTRAKTPTRKRKIRLSGVCAEYPRFMLKDQYLNSGITISGANTFVSPNMTAAEAAKFDEQFTALVKGCLAGDKFTQMDNLGRVAPKAAERIRALQRSSQPVPAASGM